jgi:hypothetical protein
MRNPTAQQLDPLGGITARPLVVVAVFVAVAVAGIMSVVTSEQVSRPALEAAALVAITASGLYYIRATSPFRASFSMRSHAVVCLLALAAVLLNAFAQWGGNAVIRDDWGPVAMAIMTVTLGSYRPAREIVICTLVTGGVIAVLAAMQAETFRSDVPALVYALLPATPVFAAGAAAATFSRSLVGSLLAWRASAGSGAASAPDAPGDAAPAKSSHLVHLDDQVIPFLAGVYSTASLTEADGTRARVLARELRMLMVMDAERSWLERIVRRVSDPDRLAEGMGESERGFLRAVVAHVRHSDVFDDDTLRVSLVGSARGRQLVIEVDSRPGRNARVQLAPYIAVAHSLFAGVDWQIAGATLSIVLAAETPARLEDA